MTPEERSLLERTHKLAEENNELLRGMRRMSRITSVARISYWVVILLVGFGAYYFIQPYVQSMFSLYTGIQENLGTSPGTSDLLLNLFK